MNNPINTPDLQLLSAGQTVEFLSRLLGAAIHKLGGSMSVTEQELRQLNGMQLEHGLAADSNAFVVRLAVNSEEVERQATVAGEARH